MNRQEIFYALVSISLLTLAGGCSKEPEGEAASSTGDASAEQPATVSDAAARTACQLVTREEAERLTGLKVIEVNSELANECKYKVGDEASLQVAWTPDAGAAGFDMVRRGAVQGVQQGLPPAVALEGIGDEALFQQHGDGLFQTLTARKGEGVLVIGSRGAFLQGRNLKDSLSAAAITALARAQE